MIQYKKMIHNATVFVGKNKVYALASLSSNTEFEVNDPILSSEADGYVGRVTYYGYC